MLNTAKFFEHVMPASILLLTLMLLSPLSSAVMLHDSYSCAVKAIKKLGDEGSLVPDEFYYRLYSDSTFVIDRHTGRMLGEPKNYSGFDQPEVIDRGSEKQSLKVITTYGPYVSIDYLLVQIYVDTLDKPFMYVSGATIYTGLCKGL